MRWWDLRTLQNMSSATFKGPITSMELSPQTGRLVVTSGNHVSFIPALPSSQPSHSLRLPYQPSSASVHPILQDRFVTGNLGDEWVRVHGMEGEEREVLKGHHGPVHCVEYSPDGEMYASGSGEHLKTSMTTFSFHLIASIEDGTIRLWQTTPGKAYGLWQGAGNGA
jgi:serine-threonine kinase receptor-associated protein